ncbi:hypothetical protein CSB37_01655 [bacterium DOLZORAL124_38_8]|nr:MAG: hypothetical protein CSB37_01655 [bacterium DOLZORAL124_38_8]
MWSKKVTIQTKAKREQIWKLWADVENWNKWDNEVEFSKINGKFETGVFGVLKPKNGPKSKFKIFSVSEPSEFAIEASLPFTKMYFTHLLEEKNGNLYLTHGIEMKGFLSFLFSRVVGKKLLESLPHSMKKLSDMAENS